MDNGSSRKASKYMRTNHSTEIDNWIAQASTNSAPTEADNVAAKLHHENAMKKLKELVKEVADTDWMFEDYKS